MAEKEAKLAEHKKKEKQDKKAAKKFEKQKDRQAQGKVQNNSGHTVDVTKPKQPASVSPASKGPMVFVRGQSLGQVAGKEKVLKSNFFRCHMYNLQEATSHEL